MKRKEGRGMEGGRGGRGEEEGREGGWRGEEGGDRPERGKGPLFSWDCRVWVAREHENMARYEEISENGLYGGDKMMAVRREEKEAKVARVQHFLEVALIRTLPCVKNK